MKKILKVFVFILIATTCLYSQVYAASITLNQLDGSGAITGDVKTIGYKILSIFSIIGSAVSIIAIIILGIKYMLGSLEERAQYKKTLLPYLIGAIFVFGATTIPGIVYNMFN